MEKKERLQRLKNRLEMYYECEEKILMNQSYSIGSRSLTRANLAEVKEMIASLENQIEDFEKRGTTKRAVRRIVPM